MIKFELNKGGSKIRIERILKRLEKIISSEFKKSGIISVAFIGGEKIREYNKKYRHKNKTTDILTFVLNPVRSPLRHSRRSNRLKQLTSNGVNENDCLSRTFPRVGGKVRDLGEIILSPKDVARRAKATGKILQETAVFLIVHGILHIMGYTHKKNRDTAAMEAKEKYLLKKLYPPKFLHRSAMRNRNKKDG